jgi:hypothetical protein
MIKFPKNTKEYRWTQHIKNKMLFYNISEQKIKTVLKSYNRKEKGIAPNTIAVMKRNDKPKRKEEIWVMYQEKAKIKNKKAKIMISAWRYPGKSRPGKEIFIPGDTLSELTKIIDGRLAV